MTSRRQTPFFTLLLTLTVAEWICAADAPRSLILVEYGKDSRGAQTQTLVLYHFSHGVRVAKEGILTSSTSDLRYDLGANFIHEDRYVITAWGDVIDLISRRLLFKSQGELLGIDGASNSVIVRVDREKEEGIYAFDLTHHRYRRVRQPGRWAMPGTVSPNGRMSAVGRGASIWLHDPTGRRVLLGSDFYREGTPSCQSTAVPTFVWLDDRHLLTQRHNGHLIVVDVDGHITPFVSMQAVKPLLCGPELRRDQGNQVHYDTAETAWLINPAGRSVSPYQWEARGHGFELEHHPDASYGHTIRYHGKDIGRWWCDDAVTAPGHIAVTFGPVGSNLGYPQGVKVWSAETGAWTTIEPEWLAAIVGWVAR